MYKVRTISVNNIPPFMVAKGVHQQKLRGEEEDSYTKQVREDIMSYALRLTKLQTELLIPALRQVYISHINYEKNGYSPDSHPEADRSCKPHLYGASDPEHIKVFLNLWDRVRSIRENGGRIYGLDAFGLAACIFAVRITMRKIRHGHHEAWSPRLDRAADHLVARLERERKRLKRSMIAESGKAVYEKQAQRWTSFIRFLHFNYVYCRCSYRRRNNLYRTRCMTINQFVQWTEEELRSRNEVVPPNLRQLVRRLVSYIRRGRTNYLLPQLRKDPVFAKYVFVNYVLFGYIRR